MSYTIARHNLLRDGHEATAEAVALTVRKRKGCVHVFVSDDGGVRCIRDTELVDRKPRPDHERIGRYRGDVPVEVIENDLLAWLRERSERRAA